MKLTNFIIVLCIAVATATDSDNSTTNSPSNITTNQVTTPTPTPQQTNDTTTPVATTEPATTTFRPIPVVVNVTKNSYNYTKPNGTVCLLATFGAQFTDGKEYLNVSDQATVNEAASSCRKLTVDFRGGSSFTIVFNMTDKKSFYISEVYASLYGVVDLMNDDLKEAKVANGSSYLCNSGLNIDLYGSKKNLTFKMTDVQLQPYYVKDGKFATALECNADISINMIIPIAVGCALGGLIVVVVVVYCILQARSKPTPNYTGINTGI